MSLSRMRDGFREVGRRERVGKMKGVWRDVILLKRRSKGCRYELMVHYSMRNPWGRMMKKSIAVWALLVTLGSSLYSARAQQKDVESYEMTTYYVALLYRGPKWTPEVTEETKRIQEGHMANIHKMAASGKLILAGPFSDDGKLRGMFVFQVGSMEEAKALTDSDPAVQAGRLAAEIHPWYSAKGIRVDPPKRSQ